MARWLPDSFDSPTEILSALAGVTGLLGLGRWWRTGGLRRAWDGVVAVLAAPVERDICHKESAAKDRRIANLEEDNARLEAEVERLRTLLYGGGSSGGSSPSGDG